jgi:hypothetical protein
MTCLKAVESSSASGTCDDPGGTVSQMWRYEISGCTAPDFLDTELSLFMQRLLAQGAAAELAAA